MVEFEYVCPVHGIFEVEISIHEEIPPWSLCPHEDEHNHETCFNDCEYSCLLSSPLRWLAI